MDMAYLLTPFLHLFNFTKLKCMIGAETNVIVSNEKFIKKEGLTQNEYQRTDTGNYERC